tara:strand:- start:8443 stop:9246 length:804 start_codon:yes stop_codon:yes gene_type:complete
LKIRLGLFDSGVGGLTVLKRVVERHGNLPCVYLGDLARVPYGEKSVNEIQKIAKEVVEWLVSQDVTAVLIACNTTNSLALDLVEKIAAVPVFSLIESVVSMVHEKRIGVLATQSTVNSRAYTKKILESDPDKFVIEQACPMFVPMIEAGQINSFKMRLLAFEYLQPLLKANVEAIILGCSHYPLLKPLLKELIPENVRLVDPAVGIAQKLDNFVCNTNFVDSNNLEFSNTRFCVTSESTLFSETAMDLLRIYPQLEIVSLRSKACVS